MAHDPGRSSDMPYLSAKVREGENAFASTRGAGAPQKSRNPRAQKKPDSMSYPASQFLSATPKLCVTVSIFSEPWFLSIPRA